MGETRTETMRIRGAEYPVGPDRVFTLTGREQLIIADALAGLMARTAGPEELTEVMRVMLHLTLCDGSDDGQEAR